MVKSENGSLHSVVPTMASKPSSPASTIEDLVSCPICLETFSDPRALPCMHSYCKRCLEKLVSRQGKITCPHCRKQHKVPGSDVGNFSANFYLNSLLEITTDPSDLSSVTDDKENSGDCPKHEGRPCELKCEDCQKAICYKCVAKDGDCHKHSYTDIRSMADSYRQELEVFSKKASEKMSVIEQHVSLLEDIRAQQTANYGELREAVDARFKGREMMLTVRKVKLLSIALDKHELSQVAFNETLEHVQTILARTRNARNLCDQVLALGDTDVFIKRYLECKNRFIEFEFHDLVTELDTSQLKFEANDALVDDVVASYGSVSDGGSKDGGEKEKMTKGKDSWGDAIPTRTSHGFGAVNNAGTSRAYNQPDLDERPSTSSEWNGQQSVASTSEAGQPVSWKFYYKNSGAVIGDRGLTVDGSPHGNTSVIGMPGVSHGRHTWTVRYNNLESGFAVGVTPARGSPGTTVVFDRSVNRFSPNGSIVVEVDCKTRTVRVKTDRRGVTILQYGKGNAVVCPYFVLFPTRNGVVSVVDMDGRKIEEQSSPECCLV